MSEFSISLSPEKTWGGGFIENVEVTNTGTTSLTSFSIDVTTTANVIKSWGGTATDLGDGTWRLTFDDALIEPGETASLSLKARGDNDITVTGTSEPAPEPTPEPTPTPDPVADPVADPAAGEITVSPGITAAELQALIDGAEPGTVIRMEAGQYHFDATIHLNTDGVSVIGAGSDATFIDVTGLDQEAFAVGTGNRSGNFTLAGDVAEGGTVIELTGSHSFEAGDYVYLERESTLSFYDSIGDMTWRNTSVPLRTSIVRVASVDGNTVTLESGVHFDFTTGETTVREINLAQDVSLGGFTVDYGLGTADPSLFENTLSQYDRDAVIQVYGTDGLKLFDVTSHDVPSLGVNVALSIHASVDSIEMTGAHNKGAGGNGYALQIRDVYDSSFSHMSDLDMRHSVVFASWRSAVNNTVHVSSTDRDINFHGGRDHGNVVMVDNSIRDANSDIIGPTLFFNTEGTHYGTATDADANTALFGNVVGTRMADVLRGYDAGAYLNGMGGHDQLTGGAGNDMLIGGVGDDHLIGGDGTDIARYEGRAADYEITANGDVLLVDEVSGYDTDTVEQVEWLVFDDAALRVSDMSWHDVSATDGIFTGPASWDPFAGTYLGAATTSDPTTTTDPATTPATSDPVSDPAPASDPVSTAVVLEGTDGNDVFTVDQAGTVVNGYGGWDTVETWVDFTMSEDVEKVELMGTDAIDATGSASKDLMLGNDAANTLTGLGGNDRFFAREGDDTVRGGDGSDEIHGQGGDDLLVGGAGADTLEGGSGADTFVFETLSDSAAGAADTLLDFTSGEDVIDLSAIDADTTLDGDQDFHFGGSGAGALWVESGTLLGDVDGDGVADLAIDLGGAPLVVDDLVL